MPSRPDLPAILIVLLCAGGAAAQNERSNQTITELDLELSKLSQQLGDWDQQYPMFATMIQNLWKQNRWDSEADRFARDTALRIEQIPPWQFQKRLELIVDTVRDRYALDDAQTQRFRGQIARDAWGMTMKYGQVVMQQMQEALQTRMRGEPFTPEQVARWADQFAPLMADWQADMDRFTDEFRGGLNPTQAGIFERDVESLHKRMKYIIDSSESWKHGEWQPADWGLQDDPIHAQALRDGLLDPVRRLPPMPAHFETLSIAGDESTWRRYVLEFIRYFALDEPQRNACNAILEDLILRATRFRSAHHDEIADVPRYQRNVHGALEPVRQMFEELKFRLQQIPTESQRRTAGRAPTAR